MIKKKGEQYFNEKFVPKFNGITTLGLLLTLIIIFSFQGDIIIEQPIYVLLIAVPLILQNVISANFTYLLCRWTKQPHNIAAPASLIAASDFLSCRWQWQLLSLAPILRSCWPARLAY